MLNKKSCHNIWYTSSPGTLKVKYISFLHLCLWFIFLYYRTIFVSPSNIQFKTHDRTYPHQTSPHRKLPPPPRKFRYFFAIQIMVTLWNKNFFSDEIPNRQNIGDIGDDMPNRQNIVYYSFLWKNLSKLKGLFAKDSGPPHEGVLQRMQQKLML